MLLSVCRSWTQQLPSSCEVAMWLPKVDSEAAGWGTLMV